MVPDKIPKKERSSNPNQFINNLLDGLEQSVAVDSVSIGDVSVPLCHAEFWTSRQRQAKSIHEISYRACFKPQLPSFFIQKLTTQNDMVYDPFSGRGTTVLEAGLLGRRVVGNDINPLSRILVSPRFFPPDQGDLDNRLMSIRDLPGIKPEIDLSMFFHRQTLLELLSLRQYLLERSISGREDNLDSWIRMIATNRLTGHSKGFFSVYTLPPNQALSPERQLKINERLNQLPPYRNVRELILRKTKSLVRSLTATDIENLRKAGARAIFMDSEADATGELPSSYIDLTVTSPPFLDVVQYAQDNWLRCWFNHLDQGLIQKKITCLKTVPQWRSKMDSVFEELYRITKPGGWLAFEVGEIRKNTVKLEETIVPVGVANGFECKGVLINSQTFTKTANIWGVNNNKLGTNSNRIALFRKIV
ncbi:MAG: DNA methyltransferase [Desulfomonilaceae bacterium]